MVFINAPAPIEQLLGMEVHTKHHVEILKLILRLRAFVHNMIRAAKSIAQLIFFSFVILTAAPLALIWQS